MGYDLHITRRDDWSDDTQSSIAIQEWLALLGSDPEWRVDNAAEAPTGQGTLRYENAGLAVWLAYSGHDESGNMAWFDFRNGNIVVKNPDAEILTKMLELASRLNARVQGEEGELYGSPDHLNPVPEMIAAPVSVGAQKPWWKFW